MSHIQDISLIKPTLQDLLVRGNKILVIGLSAGGAASLPHPLSECISTADLLIGGRRQLGYFPDFAGETLTITANVESVARRLQQALAEGEQAVVLASGDPLCYGIGASLRRYLAAEVLEVIPAPSAFQLAFAALGEPWPDAALLSAHARPLSDVVAGVLSAPKAAILTDNQHTPAVLAAALLTAGLSPDSPVAVCENLGSPEQNIIRTTLAKVGQNDYALLNVFVMWRKEGPQSKQEQTKNYHLTPDTATPDTVTPDTITPDTLISDPHFQPNSIEPIAPGLPDEAFSTSAGQITKREVRLYSLAELALGPGEVMWDIGAGSGSVGIEAARAQPTATVYAVEKRAVMCQHLRENLTRFPAPNLQWVAGMAPQVLADWADPHAVFIGGSGGRLAEIIEVVQQRLQPGGRLVINLATLENLQRVRMLLPEVQVVQAQFNRGVPILEMLRFEALNPVFIVTWHKP